jgi:predicted ATP-dependent protease
MHVAIVPAGNLAELSEIPDYLRQRIKLVPVHSMTEVLAIALARPLPQTKWHGVSHAASARRQGGKVLTQHRRGGAA